MNESLSLPVFLFGCTDLLAAVFRGPTIPEYKTMAEETLPDFIQRCPTEDDDLRSILKSMAESLQALAGTDSLDNLETEYVRLFVTNPDSVPAPLYQSCHEEGEQRRVLGPSAQAMQERFNRAGLEPNSLGEPADHLCLELEYLHYLQALSLSGANSTSETPAAFTRNQMLPWTERFREAVEEYGQEPFFIAAAKLLCLVLGKI